MGVVIVEKRRARDLDLDYVRDGCDAAPGRPCQNLKAVYRITVSDPPNGHSM
jgi:hypothetical protein